MLELFLISFQKDQLSQLILVLLILGLSITTALHAVVYKRESRAAVGWFGFIAAAPLIGSVFYVFLGLNRVEEKARRKNLNGLHSGSNNANLSYFKNPRLKAIKRTGESLTYSPPCLVDEVTPLNTGNEAYPTMLEAIEGAQRTISLFSYIFELDFAGKEFINALERAVDREVEVRLMVDGVGSKKDLHELIDVCEKKGIPLGIFLRVLWRPSLANLRNHRKLLIIDGNVGFTGGLNIAEIYWPEHSRKGKVLDFHFRLTGAVVRYLQQVFTDDWYFTTGEDLPEKFWAPQNLEACHGTDLARVVVDGPGDNQEKMRWHFLSAINSAEKSIRIATPYFLPDAGVSTALISAALRGVDVNVLIPGEGDHKLVNWAVHGSMWELLRHGVKLWHSPPPFDHSKLFVVDQDYTSIGSSNWDPRSLRLNFELNVELCCPNLAAHLIEVFEQKLSRSTQYTISDHEGRSFPVKVRDGFARMLSPYL